MRRSLFVLLLALTLGCAGHLPPIQQVQITHDALAQAQDFEVMLCLGVPTVAAASQLADVNHCTTATAPTIGLTDARHKSLQAQFATVIRLHRAITQQFASGATTADLTPLQQAVTAILAILGELTHTPEVAQLTALVQSGAIK